MLAWIAALIALYLVMRIVLKAQRRRSETSTYVDDGTSSFIFDYAMPPELVDLGGVPFDVDLDSY